MRENYTEIVEKTKLTTGSHKSMEKGACIMELVSYLANEPWSDHPECSCPVLTSFAIRYNDRVDDAHREKLKTLIPKLIGSRNPQLQKPRYEHMALKSITVFLPILTEALDLTEVTAKLRAFTKSDWLAARDYIQSQRPVIKEAMRKKVADAAYAYAYAYAYAAAYADAASAAAASAASAAAASASAASASAYAYADASASAYAAYAYAYAAKSESKKNQFLEAKKFWTDIKLKLWAEWFKALEEACEIKGDK